ncbi:hypothetical protein [Rubrivivax albus]|uniref:Uncharacterized protein n=1 Tax=Rubrivivax albus TaxID=2499835 RepID=A0A437JT68_9BURK|nr:hypothetical protein [Rubrivivax albus]RVT50377.1 hypothetical protein ENE75_15275 [Rubrivivax albus]
MVQNPHADFQLAPPAFHCVENSARMAHREQLAGLPIKLGATPGGVRRIEAVLTLRPARLLHAKGSGGLTQVNDRTPRRPIVPLPST